MASPMGGQPGSNPGRQLIISNENQVSFGIFLKNGIYIQVMNHLMYIIDDIPTEWIDPILITDIRKI
jgi:hypothetical protein